MRRIFWLVSIAAATLMTPLDAVAVGRLCADLSKPPTDFDIIDNPTSKAAPRYPQEAIAKRLEGFVWLDLTISPQGDVTDVKVIKAEPPGMFEQSTIEAVRTWTYCPSGRTISSKLKVNFELPPEMRQQ